MREPSTDWAALRAFFGGDMPVQTIERVSVWTALSELFLDTELSDGDLRRIADVLKRSPFSRDEVERILREEVSPAFTFNLLSVAGEWTPWSDQDVRAIVGQWLRRKFASGWFARLRSYARPRIIPVEWDRVAALLE